LLYSGGTLTNTYLCVADGTTGGIDCNVANSSDNWNTAYSWGDFAGLFASQSFRAELDALSGLIICDGSGNYSATADNSTDWDTAYGWGQWNDIPEVGDFDAFPAGNQLTYDTGANLLNVDDPFSITSFTATHASISDDLTINDELVVSWEWECHTIASVSDTDINLGFSVAPVAMTVINVYCYVQGGTSAVVTLGDGTNSFEAITCTTAGAADDGSITNATFTALEQIEFDIGTVTGTVRSCTICIKKQY